MLIVYKNKGILVLLYLIVSFIGTGFLSGMLHRNISGPFSEIDFYTTIGLAFLCDDLIINNKLQNDYKSNVLIIIQEVDDYQ